MVDLSTIFVSCKKKVIPTKDLVKLNQRYPPRPRRGAASLIFAMRLALCAMRAMIQLCCCGVAAILALTNEAMVRTKKVNIRIANNKASAK